MNVCRTPSVEMILPGVRAWFDGHAAVSPFRLGQHASAAGEIGIQRRAMCIRLVPVAARCIRLPDFDECVPDGILVFIEHPAAHNDPFTYRFSGMLMRQVIVIFSDVAVTEYRSGDFR